MRCTDHCDTLCRRFFAQHGRGFIVHDFDLSGIEPPTGHALDHTAAVCVPSTSSDGHLGAVAGLPKVIMDCWSRISGVWSVSKMSALLARRVRVAVIWV